MNPEYPRLRPVRRGLGVEVTFDLSAPDPREKRMRLTFFLRPGATPQAIDADIRAICGRISEAEIGLGGKGLSEDGPRVERGGEHPVVRTVLRAAEPVGSGERLAKLVDPLGFVTVPVPPAGLMESESFREVIFEILPPESFQAGATGLVG